MSKGWHRAGDGGTRAWRKVRAEVLAENSYPPPRGNNGQCTLAIENVCTGVANSAHHTLGRALTGDDRRYVVACCSACNHHIGNPQRLPDPPARPVTRW